LPDLNKIHESLDWCSFVLEENNFKIEDEEAMQKLRRISSLFETEVAEPKWGYQVPDDKDEGNITLEPFANNSGRGKILGGTIQGAEEKVDDNETADTQPKRGPKGGPRLGTLDKMMRDLAKSEKKIEKSEVIEYIDEIIAGLTQYRAKIQSKVEPQPKAED
jgi:hypothetical protein